MSEGLAARRAALAAVVAVEVDGAYSNLAVPEAVAGLASERDRAFASHLAYEMLRWSATLDWALRTVLQRSVEQVEPALARILRLGALQLLRTAVPPRAAVDTSVRLARSAVPKGRADGAAGFVNGVLRALSRETESLPWPDAAQDPIGHLVLTTAHPRWIVEELVARLGYQPAQSALVADNEPPGVTLRATGDREALVGELLAAGFDATPGRLAPEAVRAPGSDPRRLAAVEQGRAVPQDEASMLVAHATRVAAGDRVLDLCAGPGGKATHLAVLAGTAGSVVALELHAHRAALIRAAAQRLGVEVDVVVGDATDLPADLGGPFDVVLVDAPCSDLGTGRRRPEVRWRRTPADVAQLAGLQERLLHAGAGQVRTGGHLTFAVCTWTDAETDAVADAFARATHGRFEEVERRQLWPHRDGTDAMFHVAFRRRA